MKVAILLLSVLISHSSLAQERYEFFKGIRQMSMGGAAIATVNDETSLLSNPAGLGRLRDYFVTLIDPEIEVGGETDSVLKADLLKSTDPQFVLDKCILTPDKMVHTRAQIFPSIVVPNFGFGIFGKYQVDAKLNSLTNLFQYDYTNDYAAVFGFNFRFFNGIIKLGTNARIVNRTEVRNSAIAASSTNLLLKDLASSGLGVANDTGLILTAPIVYLPTLAGVYRDVGGTSYGLRDGLFMTTTTRPVATPATVDVALAIHPIIGRGVRSTWTVEYRDLLTYSKETDHMRRAHGGVEFNIADAFFIRGGLNQRYWTGGIELSMFNYQFQVGSYGEDVGVVGSPIEDRRYEVKFAFRF